MVLTTRPVLALTLTLNPNLTPSLNPTALTRPLTLTLTLTNPNPNPNQVGWYHVFHRSDIVRIAPLWLEFCGKVP